MAPAVMGSWRRALVHPIMAVAGWRGFRQATSLAGSSLLLAAVLAGCGRTATAAATSSSGALPSPLAPAQKASLSAAAREIDLAPRDLTAYRAGAPRSIWRAVEAGPSARCLGLGTYNPVVDVPSPRFFARGALVARAVSSDVVVFPSASLARRVGEALAGQAAAKCLQGSVRRSLAPLARRYGLHFSIAVQTTPMAFPLRGGAVCFAYRFALSAIPSAATEYSFAVYDDLIGFVAGPALVELNDHSARALFPRGLEQHLVGLLQSRSGSRAVRSKLGVIPAAHSAHAPKH